jgi:hypothetical protein
MARIEEIRVDPWHPWFIFFLGCGFAALNLAYALALRAKKSPAIANSGLVVPGL